jgi:hypothetical protein
MLKYYSSIPVSLVFSSIIAHNTCCFYRWNLTRVWLQPSRYMARVHHEREMPMRRSDGRWPPNPKTKPVPDKTQEAKWNCSSATRPSSNGWLEKSRRHTKISVSLTLPFLAFVWNNNQHARSILPSLNLHVAGRATIVEGGEGRTKVRSPWWGCKQFLVVLYLCRMIGQKGQTACLTASRFPWKSHLVASDGACTIDVLVGTNTWFYWASMVFDRMTLSGSKEQKAPMLKGTLRINCRRKQAIINRMIRSILLGSKLVRDRAIESKTCVLFHHIFYILLVFFSMLYLDWSLSTFLHIILVTTCLTIQSGSPNTHGSNGMDVQNTASRCSSRAIYCSSRTYSYPGPRHWKLVLFTAVAEPRSSRTSLANAKATIFFFLNKLMLTHVIIHWMLIPLLLIDDLVIGMIS